MKNNVIEGFFELFSKKKSYNGLKLCNFTMLFEISATIAVCHNCFCICHILWQHYGISIFSILLHIKKLPKITAID